MSLNPIQGALPRVTARLPPAAAMRHAMLPPPAAQLLIDLLSDPEEPHLKTDPHGRPPTALIDLPDHETLGALPQRLSAASGDRPPAAAVRLALGDLSLLLPVARTPGLQLPLMLPSALLRRRRALPARHRCPPPAADPARPPGCRPARSGAKTCLPCPR